MTFREELFTAQKIGMTSSSAIAEVVSSSVDWSNIPIPIYSTRKVIALFIVEKVKK